MKRCRKDLHDYEGRQCRECNLANQKRWHESNKKKQKAYDKKWREDNKDNLIAWKEANPDYFSNYYQVNREYLLTQSKCYAKSNKAKHSAQTAKYRATKINATPAWANLEEIEQFYIDAEYIQQLTQTPMHVDHVIPLQGKYVSGLHVENNLQISTAEENLSKGNKYVLES